MATTSNSGSLTPIPFLIVTVVIVVITVDKFGKLHAGVVLVRRLKLAVFTVLARKLELREQFILIQLVDCGLKRQIHNLLQLLLVVTSFIFYDGLFFGLLVN